MRLPARRWVIAAVAGITAAGAVAAFANSLTVNSKNLDARVVPTSLTTTSTTSGGVTTFAVSIPTSAIAGTSFNVSVQAMVGPVVDASFIGAKCVTLSGPANSPAPSNTAPTYPVAGACPAGQSAVTFSLGTATIPVTLYRAGSGITVTVTSGARTGTSGAAFVNSKGVTLAWAGSCPATHTKNTVQTYGLNVPLDQYSNPFTSSAGLTVGLSLTGTDAANYKFANTTQSSSATFSTGTANRTFTVEASGSKKDATLSASMPAGSGFTAPSNCLLQGTN